jgi:hypothetical protein
MAKELVSGHRKQSFEEFKNEPLTGLFLKYMMSSESSSRMKIRRTLIRLELGIWFINIGKGPLTHAAFIS